MSPGSPGAGGVGPSSDAEETSSNGYGNVGASSQQGHGHGRHRAPSAGRELSVSSCVLRLH
jgi:hypothetical protein